jgi:YNFM family putative membrane transporter
MTPQKHRSGEADFRRASVALFAAGMSTFALLYVAQPLMPDFASSFRVSPTVSALTLAVTTGSLALALIPAGWLSDEVGRVPVMIGSVLLGSLLGLAAAFAPSFPFLLALRALQGIALAGLPAVAMAYLTEEIHPVSLGLSIGLYVGGNALGGMLGRLIAGGLAALGGWRLGLAGVAIFGLACALTFIRLLPRSANFRRRRFQPRLVGRSLAAHVAEPGLLRLDLMGALLMGAFVAIYNGMGFRLAAAPYDLGQLALAAVFLVYPIGSFSAATAGRLSDRVGRRTVLPIAVLLFASGLALTAAHSLALVVVGLTVLTAGFFASHSVASSWVGRRAPESAAQAASIYLFAYYVGSSISGPLAGDAWSSAGWIGVMTLAGSMLVAALAVSLRLRVTPAVAGRTVPAG